MRQRVPSHLLNFPERYDNVEKTDNSRPDPVYPARKNAMANNGYISTQTLVNYHDPTIITVLSMWQNKEDWDNCRSSSMRQENKRKFEEILDGETVYEIYNMGMQQ